MHVPSFQLHRTRLSWGKWSAFLSLSFSYPFCNIIIVFSLWLEHKTSASPLQRFLLFFSGFLYANSDRNLWKFFLWPDSILFSISGALFTKDSQPWTIAITTWVHIHTYTHTQKNTCMHTLILFSIYLIQLFQYSFWLVLLLLMPQSCIFQPSPLILLFILSHCPCKPALGYPRAQWTPSFDTIFILAVTMYFNLLIEGNIKHIISSRRCF